MSKRIGKWLALGSLALAGWFALYLWGWNGEGRPQYIGGSALNGVVAFVAASLVGLQLWTTRGGRVFRSAVGCMLLVGGIGMLWWAHIASTMLRNGEAEMRAGAGIACLVAGALVIRLNVGRGLKNQARRAD